MIYHLYKSNNPRFGSFYCAFFQLKRNPAAAPDGTLIPLVLNVESAHVRPNKGAVVNQMPFGRAAEAAMLGPEAVKSLGRP